MPEGIRAAPRTCLSIGIISLSFAFALGLLSVGGILVGSILLVCSSILLRRSILSSLISSRLISSVLSLSLSLALGLLSVRRILLVCSILLACRSILLRRSILSGLI